jgi:hypothetical protein
MDSHTGAILIISGGAGSSAEQVVNTVLAQFPGHRVQVTTVPNVRFQTQVDEMLNRAKHEGALVVHTLVVEPLRTYLIHQAAQLEIPAVDLMGPILSFLARVTGHPPIGQPGLYRQLHRPYYDRVAAIDFALAHDDGKNPAGWVDAEILLVGVSRVSKTPLSLYLSVLGWKVANLPIVMGLALPAELSEINHQRVFGLTMAAGQLLLMRQQRQQSLGIGGRTDYTNPLKIYEELEFANKLFLKSGYNVIDVTDKPIETSADEIIRQVTNRFGLAERAG